MKVKELIEILSTVNPELHVFIKGYEGGYNDCTGIKEITVGLNVYHEEWNGKHENAMNKSVFDTSDYELVEGITFKPDPHKCLKLNLFLKEQPFIGYQLVFMIKSRWIIIRKLNIP